MATIVARMTIGHTFDGQDTTPSTHLGNQDVLIIVIEKRLVVEGPADVEGQITLRQGTLVGYVLAQMGGLRTRGKGRDLGQDLRDTQNKVRKSTMIYEK